MAEFLNSSDEILSVGEFSRRLKNLISARVPELWLRGEVSNVRQYQSGHVYFTLKDADASVSAVLFRGFGEGSAVKPRDGKKILAYGEVSVYPQRGVYQLIVKVMLPDGAGDLAARFEALKAQLAAEGLFDQSRKIAIPKVAKKIAVVTSPDGAAVRDFLRILERRGWRGTVCIIPSKVQGEGAAREIADAVSFADTYRFADGPGVEVIVVTRGGGSLEDLFCFNEEIVARAVAAAELPVISAVGHEIDFTLSDFAADLRAETPSGAAEIISSGRLECAEILENAERYLDDYFDVRTKPLRERIAALADALKMRSPTGRLANSNLALDEFSARLSALAERKLSAFKYLLGQFAAKLDLLNPEARIRIDIQKLELLDGKLKVLGVDFALSRGFALVRDGGGKTVVRAADLYASQKISLRFADGEKSAEILGDGI